MAKGIFAGIPPHPLPPGVKREECFWGDLYSGRPEELVKAGLIRSDQVPPPCKRVTYVDGQQLPPRVKPRSDVACLQVSWRSKKTMNVHIRFDPSLQHEREQKHAMEAKAKQEAARAKRDLEFYSKPENLREQGRLSLRILDSFVGRYTEGLGDPDELNGVCSFSPEGVDEVTDAIAVIAEWLENAEIHLPKRLNRLELARKDRAFVAFMQSQCLGE